MPRYHLNPKGEPGLCKAMVSCPFGDLDEAHYGSPAEARKAYEESQAVTFLTSRPLPTVDKSGKPLKAPTEVQHAAIEVLNDKEWRLYLREVLDGMSPAGALRSVDDRRNQFVSGFQNPSEARKRAKALLGGPPVVKPLAIPHEEPESHTTKAGTTYSKVTKQPDGRQVQTVNGVDILIHPKNKTGDFKVQTLQGVTIGWLTQHPRTGKWEVTYAGGESGRTQQYAMDANAALIKKAGLVKATSSTPKTPTTPKGYEPQQSELDLYGDFPTNSKRTVGRLRRLTSEDLVRMFNQLELRAHSSSYSDEINSDLAAQGRIKKVLAERGKRLTVSQYGTLRPGEDHASASSYKLEES